MAQQSFFIPQTLPYVIPTELYDAAYRLYQRRFLLWKHWILEGILLLLSVDFVVTAWKDPSNALVYFLLVLCLVLLVCLLLYPLRVRRRVMDAVKQVSEIAYTIELSESQIVIQTVPLAGEVVIPPTVLPYDSDLQIIEDDAFFLFCEGKERFYVLPKKALYDEQIFAMRRFFRQRLAKRFQSKL
jgi:hypothetical protein